MSDTIRHLLILLPNNLGDVIMAAPVLEGVAQAYPQCEITFLVEDGFEAGIVNNPYCHNIFLFPRKKIRDALNLGDGNAGLNILRSAVSNLAQTPFCRIVNLSQNSYVASLASLVPSADIRGQKRLVEGNFAISDPWSHYLYAIPFARQCNRLHATDVYRRIAGVRAHRHPGVVLKERERTEASARLGAAGIHCDGSPLAVFQPGAALAAKRWPPEHWIELARRLVSQGWQIVVSGAPAEYELAASIATAVGTGCVATAGTTSFREALAQVSCARVCVTGDTALMHAAAGLQVKVVALFGSTSPLETGPWGNGHWILAGRCADRPCFCKDCKTMLCMRSILPETVLACINGADESLKFAGCDAYRTRLSDDGDYSLQRIGAGMAYYSEPASYLTLKAMGEEPAAPVGFEDELNLHLQQSARFVSSVLGMYQHLQCFQKTLKKEHVSRFEQAKASLSSLQGVGAFWTAMLNLRLNSIPTLDPLAAVADSARVCRQLAVDLQERLFNV